MRAVNNLRTHHLKVTFSIAALSYKVAVDSTHILVDQATQCHKVVAQCMIGVVFVASSMAELAGLC